MISTSILLVQSLLIVTASVVTTMAIIQARQRSMLSVCYESASLMLIPIITVYSRQYHGGVLNGTGDAILMILPIPYWVVIIARYNCKFLGSLGYGIAALLGICLFMAMGSIRQGLGHPTLTSERVLSVFYILSMYAPIVASMAARITTAIRGLIRERNEEA